MLLSPPHEHSTRLKSSLSLTEEQSCRIWSSALNARQLEIPMNKFISVHWEALGVDAAASCAATLNLIKRLRDYAAIRRSKFAYIWVREDDFGDNKIGSHVHILIGVGPTVFPKLTRRMLRKWLKKISSVKYVARAIKTLSIAGHRGFGKNEPQTYMQALNAVVKYLLKGVDPLPANRLSLNRRLQGGKVIGKRFGISRNIDTKIDNSNDMLKFKREFNYSKYNF